MHQMDWKNDHVQFTLVPDGKLILETIEYLVNVQESINTILIAVKLILSTRTPQIYDEVKNLNTIQILLQKEGLMPKRVL